MRTHMPMTDAKSLSLGSFLSSSLFSLLFLFIFLIIYCVRDSADAYSLILYPSFTNPLSSAILIHFYCAPWNSFIHALNSVHSSKQPDIQLAKQTGSLCLWDVLILLSLCWSCDLPQTASFCQYYSPQILSSITNRTTASIRQYFM